jgi:hypothetical protein
MKRDIKRARRTGLRQSAAGDQARPSRTERIRANFRMTKVTVRIEATTILTWNGGNIDVNVSPGASRAEIEASIVRHLMTNDAGVDWVWGEAPEIHEFEVIDVDEAE